MCFRSVRWWFRGQDDDPEGRKWESKGVGLGIAERNRDGSTNEELEKLEDLWAEYKSVR